MSDLSVDDAEMRESQSATIGRALALCAEVLDLGAVEVSDNFLDLGGDSFSAIELSARLSEVCGCEIQVDDLFTAETFASLFESKL
jgi:acyl carrier protein